jgi:hypothetical protein
MEIMIQQELREMSQIKKYLPSDILEIYLDIARLYSKDSWLVLQDEYLRRMEFEIAIL